MVGQAGFDRAGKRCHSYGDPDQQRKEERPFD